MSDEARPLRPLRIPIRAVATAIAAFALLAPFTDAWGLGTAVLAALCGVVVGEALAYSRIKTGVALGVAAATFAIGGLSARALVGWSVFAAVLGPSTALVLSSVVGIGLATTALVAGLRVAARRVETLQAVELAGLALAAATAFAAHRDGALARPLWLTDRAWQLGVDPGDVLLAIGAVSALLLAGLQLLETRHRLPWFSWVWLPVIALVAFLLADVTTSEPPTSPELDAIQSAMDRPPEAKGTEGEPKDGGDGDGEPKDGGQGGQDGEAKPELGPDGQPVKPELGPDGQPAKPEPGPDGQPAKPELGPDGQPAKPELGPDGQPVKPEDGDGTADAGDGERGGQPKDGDGGGKPQDGDGGGKPQDGDDGGKPQDGDDGGKPQDGDSQDKPQDGDSEDKPDDQAEPPPPKDQPDLDDQPQSNAPKNNPVAVVLLGDDYDPVAGYYYLRQEVSSEFIGTRLVPAARTDVDNDVHKGFPTGPTEVADPPPEEGRKRVHGKVAITAEHTAPFGLEGTVVMEPAYNPNPARFLRAWTFESLAPTRPVEELLGHSSGANWPDDVRDHYLQFPADDPRYQQLADELVGHLKPEVAADPFARALVIKQHLDQMAYDTSERHAGADDPTAEFLFEGDEMVGYCVHAAHASVYLLRAAGVPARVGTGYAVEEERRRGSSIVVMGKDAHAWPELYLDGIGWTILDISPAENRDPPGQPIDEEMADLLSDMAREEPDAEEVASIDWRALWHATVRTLSNLAIALFATVIVLHYLVKLWRRSRPYVATRRGIARVGYRAAIDRLAEAGFVREPGETRERFARRVSATVPSFAAVTELHLAATLGPPNADGPRSTSTWLRLLSRLGRELRGTGWKRWLGVMNPFSFYRSR